MGRTEELLLTVIIVNLGGLPVQAQRQGQSCGIHIDKGQVTRQKNYGNCTGSLNCPIEIRGQTLYSLNCTTVWIPNMVFRCSGTCPDRRTNFTASCRYLKAKWDVLLDIRCPKYVNTTTAAPKTPIPTINNEYDRGESTRRAVSWTVIVAVALSVILVTVCGFAITASRRRNALRAARGRRAHGSPLMMYSVTLSCGSGQALTDTINLYRLRNNQAENTECSLDVMKPPPYEEVVDVGFGDNVILGPPPPYSEVTDPASKYG